MLYFHIFKHSREQLTYNYQHNILTLLTDIWLVVRVPVLSEQITDVHPSVSTEGSDLTIAFFFAILLVPVEM